MQKLGRNAGAYHGDPLDLPRVLEALRTAARDHGWQMETLATGNGPSLLALHRPPRETRAATTPRLYLSAGIHGDEPAGPLAALELLRADAWPASAALWMCPCLNPAGSARNRRENAAGMDLNRDYRHPVSPEVRAHVSWLERQPAFDLAICLHEDWESHGFYLYEVNPDHAPSRAEAVIAAVRPLCPVDASEVIEGRRAAGGVIRPELDLAARPDWPEAMYLIAHKTRLSYTLEAPSDFPLATRIAALTTAVRVLTANPTGAAPNA